MHTNVAGVSPCNFISNIVEDTRNVENIKTPATRQLYATIRCMRASDRVSSSPAKRRTHCIAASLSPRSNTQFLFSTGHSPHTTTTYIGHHHAEQLEYPATESACCFHKNELAFLQINRPVNTGLFLNKNLLQRA